MCKGTHSKNKKGPKRSAKPVNVSDVQCPYHLRSQRSGNKGLKDDTRDGLEERGDEVEKLDRIKQVQVM